MILPFTFLILCVSHINALKPLFDHPTCDLSSTLRSLNAQKLDPANILQAAAAPGICPLSELPRYSKPSELIKLAYITPWNGHGYDLAKWFASKLTHISPVWYQLVISDAKPDLRGGHDVDEEWLETLRNAHRPPKIVPRVQLQFSQKVAEAILYYPQRGQVQQIADAIVDEVLKYGYDGVTVELPAPHVFADLIRIIGEALHDIDKELVLVVPPQHTAEQAGMVFASEHIAELEDTVDYFSVMTYDHAGAMGTEGPNSPLKWVEQVVGDLIQGDDNGDDLEDDEELTEVMSEHKMRASKVLLGIPFYGYRFSRNQAPEAYTASNYVDLLKEATSPIDISWDESSKEHRLALTGSSLWYPTLLSLLYRLQLAEELGVGIAIWELGQGMDHFIDAL